MPNFPQSATSVARRIPLALAGKMLFVAWAASADSVHVLLPGATSTIIVTRATSGATFNSTTGRIGGTSNGYFSFGVSGGLGGRRENSDMGFCVAYLGDVFNSVNRTMIGSALPEDVNENGFAARGKDYGLGAGFQNSGRLNTGVADPANDQNGWMIFGARQLNTDAELPTIHQRFWAAGAEYTPSRATSLSANTSLIGDTARPLYFGGTQASGNDVFEFEAVCFHTGMSNADMEALTANPASWTEEVPAPPAAVDLLIANMTGGATVATGTVTYTPPTVGVTNLAGAPMSGASSIAAGAITYAPPTIKLTTDPFTAWGDPTPLVGLTVPHSSVSALDGTFLFHVAGAVTDSLGRLVFQNNGMTAGSDYAVSNWDATGANRGCKIYRAA